MAIEKQIDNEQLDDLEPTKVDDGGAGSDLESQDTQSESAQGADHAVKKPSKFKLILFIQQIISEVKRVVSPTRQELSEYTIVVLVFVLVIMLFITGADVAIGQLVMALFAK
jgi:preprotein translocase subunit SecE